MVPDDPSLAARTEVSNMYFQTGLMIAAFVLVVAGRAEASNVAVIATAPGLFNLIVLLVAFACVFVGYQIRTSVKGGLLCKSWRLFTIGFGVLALAQMLNLLNRMEVLSLPAWIVPGMLVIMAGVLLMGLRETKRVLG